uniref:Uncharacterized protein n=1 Tax=Kalanchoe fedtschenkoi TaxID=63787 RepID=A0A7N0T2B0_KALFE
MARPNHADDELRNCVIKPRVDRRRRREKVYVGCGAGFGGDRPMSALKLLQRVKNLDYLVLECLAERTLADRYQAMLAGADGFDPRISDWMSLLLPLAVERGVCIITNMGAMDPLGAQDKVIDIARALGIDVSVAIAWEVSIVNPGSGSSSDEPCGMKYGTSTYLGAAPIVECLERYKPDVIITSRVADAALFLAPMVYELGWNWDEMHLLAQGSLAGHLLECGCQLTGGYFMHPGDKYRNLSFGSLLDVSLPFAEVSANGKVCIAKADSSGGVINHNTCTEQLLYEVGDPRAYVTPDVIIDLEEVSFLQLSPDRVLCIGAKPSSQHVPDNLLQLVPEECGWKGWGEISYGGFQCVKRAEAAQFLVMSWMEEVIPGVASCIMSYIIGVDSLRAINDTTAIGERNEDIRLRMDGLFEQKNHAIQFTKEFTALYTNGPAGGGGISTGHKKEVFLRKELVERERVYWQTKVKRSGLTKSNDSASKQDEDHKNFSSHCSSMANKFQVNPTASSNTELETPDIHPAPSGQKIRLYEVAHSRAGDKGNDINFSVIPHFPEDIIRLKMVITPKWVKGVVSTLLHGTSFPNSSALSKLENESNMDVKVEIYEAKGVHALNVVVRNILDGGVNCSRRIDRHGKTISDLILNQHIVLP